MPYSKSPVRGRPCWSLLLLAALATSVADRPTYGAEPAPASEPPAPPVPDSPPAAAAELRKVELSQVHMGLPIRIVAYAESVEQGEAALRAGFARIAEIDAALSDYQPESELNRLCRDAQPGQPVPVSRDLFVVLEQATAVSRASDGAFDVTVAPVIQLWRAARKSKILPPASEISSALTKVGWRNIEVDALRQAVTLHQTGVRIDLGGIAAGYACDEAARVMREAGVTRVLIDASGDLTVGDPPPGRDHWLIAVEPLLKSESTVEHYPRLVNCGVTTSGDAYQFVEIDGRRYSHIVDPRTGFGLSQRSSVTVIAPTGMLADAFATTVNVLGPQAGTAFIERQPDCASLVMSLDGEPDSGGQEVRTASRSLERFLLEVNTE